MNSSFTAEPVLLQLRDYSVEGSVELLGTTYCADDAAVRMLSMKTSNRYSAIVRDLFSLLRNVRDDGGKLFSGIGVLVSDDPERLPTFPLRPHAILPSSGSTIGVLSSISQDTNDLHDGFHLLSPSLEIKALSLYFSPPIASRVVMPDLAPNIGGRYLAALFGSALPGVIAAGVVSARYGVVVFENGVEVAADAR